MSRSGGSYPRPPDVGESKRPSMSAQSLLFSRTAGWTPSKAKAWAKSHGYRYGKVDVTDQYVRIRQSDPKGFKTKRTVTFGKGIRAVVAREEEGMKSMATTTRESSRRRSPRKAGKRRARRVAAPHKRKRARKAAPVARKRRRRPTKAAPVRARRRRAREETRRSPRRRRRAAPMMMETPRRRPRKAPKRRSAPRRRRRRSSVAREAWRGAPEAHRKAAKKGWRRKKAARRPVRRRRRKAAEVMQEAPKRRRRRRKAQEQVMETSHRRRRSRRPRHRTYEARGGSRGMEVAELALALVAGGFGFVLSDGLDRFLATYDPASTTAKPTDKFTSDGVGTLANALNIAAPPGIMRIGAGVGMMALPAVGAVFVDHPFARSALEGMAVGAGVSLFKTLWNSFLMPLLKPSDTAPASLQKSIIVRLYPSEVAASINLAQKQQAVSSGGGAGALSAPADVGPFAVGGDSPYPDAAEALRAAAGVHGPGGDYPSLQNVWGTGEFQTAAQAMMKKAGLSDGAISSILAGVGASPAPAPSAGVSAYMPGPPPGPGPGPQAAPHQEPECGCIGDPTIGFTAFLGDAEEDAA